jgi:hypothetical protein
MSNTNSNPPRFTTGEWDAHYGLSNHRWHLYECYACDPDPMFPDPDEEPLVDTSGYTEPYRIIVQQGADWPEFCPRCDTRLSLTEAQEVYVSIKPREEAG